MTADLASPASLLYRHPMCARLSIPQGGIVQGSYMEIHNGARIIALQYYLDDTIAPAGVDAAQKGLVTLSRDNNGNAITSLKWQDETGAAWVFDGTTGDLLSYTSPDGVVVSDVSDCLDIRRNAQDNSIRQIWSYWDGLLNVENITASGYRIALYSADQVSGQSSSGEYELAEGAAPFKSFQVAYASTGLVITESTPRHEDYVCTWTQGADSAWSMTIGTGTEAIRTSRTRSVLESATDAGFEVWQLVTTVSKNNVAASCVAEVYQNSPMGNLLLARVEGYGSEAAQTTTYEYDGVGNMVSSVAPNGRREENWYDETGRVVKTFEPWHGEDYTLITDYAYAYSSNSRYSSEIASISRKVRQNGTNNAVTLTNESYTYTEANGIKRVEQHTTASGSNFTHLRVTETWTNDAPNALDRGRIRMTQAENGVQRLYTYAAATLHNALYTITVEEQVNGAPVAGQSHRSVSYVDAEGNVVYEEEYILLTANTWEKISGVTNTYDTQNRLVGTLRDNGRSTTRTLTCRSQPLSETDEDGIQTDYAYDSARQLTEITRSVVMDGETTVTPETITEYVRDAAGRVTSAIVYAGAMETETSASYDLLGRIISQTDALGRTTAYAYSADGLTVTATLPTGATLITARNTDGSLTHIAGTGQPERYYSYDLNGSNTRTTIRLGDNSTIVAQSTANGFGETTMESQVTTAGFVYARYEYNALGQVIKTYKDSGWNTPQTASTLYEYDSMGNEIKQTLALAEVPAPENSPIAETSYGAEILDNAVFTVVTKTRYNTAGNALTSLQKTLISESPALESKSISIDERGHATTTWIEYGTGAVRLSKQTIPTSNVTAAARSVDGFTVTRTDHAGITTAQTRAFTTTGVTLTQTDGRGNTSTSHTDLAGRVISSTDAANNTTTIVYCTDSDNPATITNAQGKTICCRYDTRGRKTAEYGTAIQPACFAYDDENRLVALTTFRHSAGDITTDPSSRTDGDTTTWAYHAASGLEVSKTYADQSSVTKSYNAFGLLAAETNARNIVKTMTYETARGLLTGISFSNAASPSQSFTYNHLGLPTQVTDAAGTRTIAYNDYNEPLTDSLAADGVTHLITEAYDAFGRSAGYTYAKAGSAQQTISIGYGTDGRINSAGFTHGGANKNFEYSYLTGSNLLRSLTMPNNMSLTQGYETSRDLLTSMTYRRGTT
ncbi:MAG: sugar-binding protein, partial [Akkermansiaceae bacterium]|nr:sugar-binding protein [Akkermansiaceae bacterium]